MTTFEAYALVTLLPSLKITAVHLLIVLGMVAVMCLVVSVATAAEISDRTKWICKRAGIAFIILGLLAVSCPSKSDIALIVALKAGTSPEAQQFYGEAGDYLKAWLKNETLQLTKP